MAKQQQEAVLSELTKEHYELIHKTKQYWINRALRGDSNFTEKDIRPHINYIYKTIGDMATDKPYIFIYDSYSAFQLGYNLIRIASEDTYGKLNKRGKKNILDNATMDKVWDLQWFGESGSSIHEAVDGRVKREIQEKVWEATARAVGDQVGMAVWDVIRQHTQNSIGETVWTNIWKKIAINDAQEIRSRVSEKVWNQCIEQLAHYTGDIVGTQVARNLETTVESMIANSNSKLQFIDHFIGLGNWAGWMSFYDFFWQAGVLKKGDGVTEEFDRFKKLLTFGIWTMAFFDDCVVICRAPKIVRRDEIGRNLHSTIGPAVEWPDGTGQYFIYGINFSESFTDSLGAPPQLWNKLSKGTLSWLELFGISNIEQRRVAIRVYGPERMMKDAKAELIDKSKRGNELYKIKAQVAVKQSDGSVKFIDDDGRITTDANHTLIPEMRVMRYKDPSTDRIYFSFVPNNINKADEGMAWKFHMTPEQYAMLKVEA